MIILASQSLSRRTMLNNVGLSFETHPADIDEYIVQKKMQEKSAPANMIALELAKAKALHVSALYPKHYIIGSDQMLTLDNKNFNKSKTIEEVKEKLRKMRGKTHKLPTGVAVVKEGQVIWSHQETASLTMHDFDDDFLDAYLKIAGDALFRSVGAYELEKHGAWLFKKIDGDLYTIMGMPLFPLLAFLDRQNLGIMK